MIRTWSILIGLVGVLGTGAFLQFLRKKDPQRKLQHYWILGLPALFPAWLIAFLAVIQPASEQAVDVPLPPPAVFSSGAGLLGVIGTDYALRRWLSSRANVSPAIYWLLGWIALLPAWLILLASL